MKSGQPLKQISLKTTFYHRLFPRTFPLGKKKKKKKKEKKEAYSHENSH